MNAPARRIRRSPEGAREEIVAAAREIVTAEGFAGLRVDRVMERTGMTRSTFYHYFASAGELAVALFEPIELEMLAAVEPWLRPEATERPEAVIADSLREVVAVIERHGSLVAALDAASKQYVEVWDRWRGGVIETFVEKTTEYVTSLRDSGASRVENPAAVARALLLMNDGCLVDLATHPDRGSGDQLAETLTHIWTATLLSPR